MPVNSLVFDALVEFTRPYFDPKFKESISQIYSPLDDGGLDIVSLEDQVQEGFNAYYDGIRRAYEDCMQKGKCGSLGPKHFEIVMSSFRDLIRQLESDERFSAHNRTR